jgi:hypothetical protein
MGVGFAQNLLCTACRLARLTVRPILRTGRLLALGVCLQECAVLDLVATQMEAQGRGHCRAMLQALEGWLGPQLGVASLIAVCPADVSATAQLPACMCLTVPLPS